MPYDAFFIADRPASAPTGAIVPATCTSARDTAFLRCTPARRFSEMQAAYRRSGGVASGHDLALMLRRRSDQPLSRLARWIVHRSVVCFECYGTTWLPLFQFELATMSIRTEVSAVVDELLDVFDDWDLAAWFAQPNTMLQDRMPVDVLRDCPCAVLDAARADRFIACG